MQQLIDHIRFYHYISGVLKTQADDPLCSKCKAYTNTLSAIREGLEALLSENKEELGSLPAEAGKLIQQVRGRIGPLRADENAEGQKKAGNCMMPKGVCFVKSSKALLKEL